MHQETKKFYHEKAYNRIDFSVVFIVENFKTAMAF